MTTIINTPSPGVIEDGSGMGLIAGILVAILAVALFFVYGLPAIRSSSANQPAPTSNTTIEITTPVPLAPATNPTPTN